MTENESVQHYLSIKTTIFNSIRSYGGKFYSQIVVFKVLRNLTTKFENLVTAIDQSKDLSAYSFE